MAKKYYVLDTNILIQTAGRALRGFDDNIVVITYTTLEELDGLKKASAEIGYNARETLRILGEIENNKGEINDKGGKLLIYGYDDSRFLVNFPKEFKLEKPDNRILAAAKILDIDTEDMSVILVTNDFAMKIKANRCGITAQGYFNDQISSDNEYEGREKISEDGRRQILGLIGMNQKLFDADAKGITSVPYMKEQAPFLDVYENKYYEIDDEVGYTLSKYKDGELHLLKSEGKEGVYGIYPKNPGQRFCIDALSAPASDIPFVIIKGPAGCGKTMLAMATGLEKVYNSDEYNKIIITRSNTLSDEELGFLPGDLEDKMMPLLAPFYDNLDFLFRNKYSEMRASDVSAQIEDLLENRMLEIVSMAYIRGRSIAKSFIIVDEAQNLTVTQAKTIVTRAGMGSKIILMGDLGQIDNNKLDKKNNGLSYLSEKFKGSPLCAQVSFYEDECVRSPLAMDAIQRLL